MERFEKILDYIFEVEGGYTDDKNDRGGKTTWGITEEEAREFGYTGDMRNLTKDFAKNIYLKGRNGIKNVQIAINQLRNANLDVDSIIGSKTLDALNAVDPEKFLEVYHNLQRLYYKGKVEADKTQERFLSGWLNRIERKEEYLKDWDKENTVTENKKYSFAQSSLDKMEKVHPKLVEVMKAAITDSPFDFRITDGARTAEEQFALYQIGRSKPGRIVTNCDGKRAKSNHQIKADGYGHAVDIFPCGVVENGVYRKFTSEEGYDEKKLKLIANHILEVAKSKNVNIEWGGNWKMKDTPHFELK